MTKIRLVSAGIAVTLLVIEVLIALFVHDSFVRPYLGDVLAVIFVYFLGRVFFPEKPAFLSVFAFGTAVAVEIIQLTPLPELLSGFPVLSVLVGGTFDFADILCYAAGGGICLAVDFLRKKYLR